MPMTTGQQKDVPPAMPTSSQHISDMLDEALDEGFPASDPVAIHVDPADTADEADAEDDSVEAPLRTCGQPDGGN